MKGMLYTEESDREYTLIDTDLTATDEIQASSFLHSLPSWTLNPPSAWPLSVPHDHSSPPSSPTLSMVYSPSPDNDNLNISSLFELPSYTTDLPADGLLPQSDSITSNTGDRRQPAIPARDNHITLYKQDVQTSIIDADEYNPSDLYLTAELHGAQGMSRTSSTANSERYKPLDAVRTWDQIKSADCESEKCSTSSGSTIQYPCTSTTPIKFESPGSVVIGMAAADTPQHRLGRRGPHDAVQHGMPVSTPTALAAGYQTTINDTIVTAPCESLTSAIRAGVRSESSCTDHQHINPFMMRQVVTPPPQQIIVRQLSHSSHGAVTPVKSILPAVATRLPQHAQHTCPAAPAPAAAVSTGLQPCFPAALVTPPPPQREQRSSRTVPKTAGASLPLQVSDSGTKNNSEVAYTTATPAGQSCTPKPTGMDPSCTATVQRAQASSSNNTAARGLKPLSLLQKFEQEVLKQTTAPPSAGRSRTGSWRPRVAPNQLITRLKDVGISGQPIKSQHAGEQIKTNRELVEYNDGSVTPLPSRVAELAIKSTTCSREFASEFAAQQAMRSTGCALDKVSGELESAEPVACQANTAARIDLKKETKELACAAPTAVMTCGNSTVGIRSRQTCGEAVTTGSGPSYMDYSNRTATGVQANHCSAEEDVASSELPAANTNTCRPSGTCPLHKKKTQRDSHRDMSHTAQFHRLSGGFDRSLSSVDTNEIEREGAEASEKLLPLPDAQQEAAPPVHRVVQPVQPVKKIQEVQHVPDLLDTHTNMQKVPHDGIDSPSSALMANAPTDEQEWFRGVTSSSQPHSESYDVDLKKEREQLSQPAQNTLAGEIEPSGTGEVHSRNETTQNTTQTVQQHPHVVQGRIMLRAAASPDENEDRSHRSCNRLEADDWSDAARRMPACAAGTVLAQEISGEIPEAAAPAANRLGATAQVGDQASSMARSQVKQPKFNKSAVHTTKCNGVNAELCQVGHAGYKEDRGEYAIGHVGINTSHCTVRATMHTIAPKTPSRRRPPLPSCQMATTMKSTTQAGSVSGSWPRAGRKYELPCQIRKLPATASCTAADISGVSGSKEELAKESLAVSVQVYAGFLQAPSVLSLPQSATNMDIVLSERFGAKPAVSDTGHCDMQPAWPAATVQPGKPATYAERTTDSSKAVVGAMCAHPCNDGKQLLGRQLALFSSEYDSKFQRLGVGKGATVGTAPVKRSWSPLHVKSEHKALGTGAAWKSTMANCGRGQAQSVVVKDDHQDDAITSKRAQDTSSSFKQPMRQAGITTDANVMVGQQLGRLRFGKQGIRRALESQSSQAANQGRRLCQLHENCTLCSQPAGETTSKLQNTQLPGKQLQIGGRLMPSLASQSAPALEDFMGAPGRLILPKGQKNCAEHSRKKATECVAPTLHDTVNPLKQLCNPAGSSYGEDFKPSAAPGQLYQQEPTRTEETGGESSMYGDQDSRKRKQVCTDDEERKARRRASNRNSAKRMRQQRSQVLAGLQQEVLQLRHMCQMLAADNERCAQDCAEIENQNQDIRSEISHLETLLSSSYDTQFVRALKRPKLCPSIGTTYPSPSLVSHLPETHVRSPDSYAPTPTHHHMANMVSNTFPRLTSRGGSSTGSDSYTASSYSSYTMAGGSPGPIASPISKPFDARPTYGTHASTVQYRVSKAGVESTVSRPPADSILSMRASQAGSNSLTPVKRPASVLDSTTMSSAMISAGGTVGTAMGGSDGLHGAGAAGVTGHPSWMQPASSAASAQESPVDSLLDQHTWYGRE